jgi:hypothetical protein
MPLSYGINPGHGYMKLVIIDERGHELPPVVFPSLVALADGVVSGAFAQAVTVRIAGQHYWTGDDALLSGQASTMLTQGRLADPVFLPALIKAALRQADADCAEALAGALAVAGLPATWAEDSAKLQALGQRVRDAAAFHSVRAIPEPVGAMYSVLLDTDGVETGDPSLVGGRWLACDWGHRTDDEVIVDRARPIKSSLETYDTGTAEALRKIAQHFSVHFDRPFTAYEADQAIRNGGVEEFGELRPLPPHWDRPLVEQGRLVAERMANTYKRQRLDGILLFGGGACEERKVAPVLNVFPRAIIADEPQTAIASGYARLGRRFLRTERL